MMIDELTFIQIRQSFQSIVRADYVSISDKEQLEKLEDYYVDYFNNLGKVLLDQDSYGEREKPHYYYVLIMNVLKEYRQEAKKKARFLEKKRYYLYI